VQDLAMLGDSTYPRALAVAGGTVFVGTDRGLFAVPASGGDPQQLADAEIGALAADASGIYWIDATFSPRLMAASLDGSHARTLLASLLGYCTPARPFSKYRPGTSNVRRNPG
jgi:hypothetical protein